MVNVLVNEINQNGQAMSVMVDKFDCAKSAEFACYHQGGDSALFHLMKARQLCCDWPGCAFPPSASQIFLHVKVERTES